MPTVTVYNAERMKAIEDNTIVAGEVIDGILYLRRYDGTIVEAGVVGGAAGSTDPEIVRDVIGSALVAGSNVTIDVDDVANTITISASGSGSTDPEVVRDTIAAALVAGAGVTISHDDPNNTITISSTATGGQTTEEIQDMIASFIQAGSNISVTYDDAGNQLTIDATTSGLTEEQVQDSISSMLQSGLGISLVYDDVNNTLTISTDILSDDETLASQSTSKAPTERAVSVAITDAITNFRQLDSADDGSTTWDVSEEGIIRPVHHGYTRTYKMNAASITVKNASVSAGPHSLLASTLVVPAGQIELNTKLLEFEAFGQLENNTGSDRTFLIDLMKDGVLVHRYQAVVPTGAGNRNWRMLSSFYFLDYFGIRPYGGGQGAFSLVGQAPHDQINFMATATTTVHADVSGQSTWDLQITFPGVMAGLSIAAYVASLRISGE